MDNSIKKAKFLLRLGLSFTLLYAPFSSFYYPDAGVGFFPLWLRDEIPAKILLSLFSVYEIILALWLLWGKYVFWAGGLYLVSVAGIIVFNIGAFDLIFRDVGLLLSAGALMALSNK